MSSCSLNLTYLVSRYPAISHTFIFGEVRELRRLGATIHVASINQPDWLSADMPEDERLEASNTFYVKRAPDLSRLAWMVRGVCCHPLGTIKGFWYATLLAGLDLRRLYKNYCYLLEAILVGAWMEKKGSSHLHVHFANAAATVGLLASSIYPITWSMTVHGPDVFSDISGLYLREKIESCRFIACISYYARSQLMKLVTSRYWDKLHVCPLGVDEEQFSPSQEKETSSVNLLCVGRLVPAKGQAILIRAVSQLVRKGLAVKLRLVGDGPCMQEYKDEVQQHALGDHVIFEGAVSPAEIKRFYESADVFVLPSFAEGVPVALMEAMAMEIPCVSTAITGIPELITNGVDGILVRPSDPESLVTAISQLIADPALVKRMGSLGRRTIKDRYSLGNNVRALAGVFQCHCSSGEHKNGLTIR